jgi:hypothetical protein
MAGPINLRLLTDFFNKIGHEPTSKKIGGGAVGTPPPLKAAAN